MTKRLLQLLRDNAQPTPKPLNLVRNQAGDATLYLYDVIGDGWGITASSVAQALSGLPAGTALNLRINSPGGDVFEARTIHTLLRQHSGPVTAYIDGLAASAATTLALGAGRVVMAPGAYWMIHNAWSLCVGNKADMTSMAGLLDKMDSTIASDYAAKTGMPVDEVHSLMDAETWMTAAEAMAAKFCDALTEADEPDEDDQAAPARNTASTTRWNLGAYNKAPQALVAPASAPAPEPDWAAIRAANERRLQLLAAG